MLFFLGGLPSPKTLSLRAASAGLMQIKATHARTRGVAQFSTLPVCNEHQFSKAALVCA